MVDEQSSSNLPAVRQTTVVETLPGLARVAGSAAVHTAEWGLRTTARNWMRVGKAITNRDEATALVREVGSYVGAVSDIARQVADGTPVAKALLNAGEALGGATGGPYGNASNGRPQISGEVLANRPQSLRERGSDLLTRSRDVWSTDDRHPAFDRILDELAPDEARILVMLLRDGPQPSVDVRTGGITGMLSSQLIAPGLQMIGPRAGVRYLEFVPSYLNNLFRLGLIWFSRESLHDYQEYQVLEAQPDVLEALHSVKFAKVVRRSIHLTKFGEELCKLALVDEVEAASEHPEHHAPPDESAPTIEA